ncbi:hypothetical protein KHA80_00680 [Anaerobacillus sp. HL2]|nr:hypothetical protein KHA80_00680 [Anaerobacillus sp. HL2]
MQKIIKTIQQGQLSICDNVSCPSRFRNGQPCDKHLTVGIDDAISMRKEYEKRRDYAQSSIGMEIDVRARRSVLLVSFDKEMNLKVPMICASIIERRNVACGYQERLFSSYGVRLISAAFYAYSMEILERSSLIVREIH